jgi:hypothetical protein
MSWDRITHQQIKTPRPTLLERFIAKIAVINEDDSDCWVWRGKCVEGYGKFHTKGNHEEFAHRVSYELFVGPIPPGKELDHLCRNHSCVNPNHLEPVTHQVNVQRGEAGKYFGKQQRTKTYCSRGHEYNSENTYIYKGGRDCRICRRERSSESWRRLHPKIIKTHCLHGHPFDEANTYIHNGKRHCRTCAREQMRLIRRERARKARETNG